MKNMIPTALISLMTALSFNAHGNLKTMVKEMNDFQKPMVDSLRHSLENDPALKGEYKIYLNEMRAISDIKDLKERERRALSINYSHKPLFEKAMKSAKIDTDKVKKQAKALSKKYTTKEKWYRIYPDLFLTYQAWTENLRQESPPVETELSFEAPFEFVHSQRNGEGTVSENLETGEFEAFAEGYFAASFKNKAGLGDYVRVPWATRTIRVSAKLPETRVYLVAYAGPGGAGASGSSKIDVLTEDGDSCVEEQEHGTVIAPVVWHSTLEMDETTLMACQMEAPPASQDIAVRFQAIADVTSGGVAFGYARVTSKPAPIRVRLIE
jgi:hypothetical protein